MSSRSRVSSVSGSVLSRISAGIDRIINVCDGAVGIVNRAVRVTRFRRRIVDSSESASDRDIGQDNVQRAQVFSEALGAIPLIASPVSAASSAVVATRALRGSTTGRLLQDEIDTLVSAPSWDSCSVGDVRRVPDVDWLGVGESLSLFSQSTSLGEGAGQDGFESALVGVAVAARRAGDFGNGAVCVGGAGKCLVGAADEADVA